MKNKKSLLLITGLVFVLLSITAYAAHESMLAFDINNINNFKNVKALQADSNRIKYIYGFNSNFNSDLIHGYKQRVEHRKTNHHIDGLNLDEIPVEIKDVRDGLMRFPDIMIPSEKHSFIFDREITSRESLKEFYNEWDNYNKNHQEHNIKEYIVEERNDLKEKELEILKDKNIDILSIDDIFHINAAYINDYPEYRALYMKYMEEHVGVGDYIPSGIYIDKESNKAYFISISDKKIYSYNLEIKD